MLSELREFKPETAKTALKHETVVCRPDQLKQVFESDLVLLPVTETSKLYDKDDFPEQYEPVKVEGNTVTHYVLSSGDFGDTISISTYFQEYLETGRVTERTSTTANQTHQSPLPIYNVTELHGQYVPCVKLKDGYKALITKENDILKGVRV